MPIPVRSSTMHWSRPLPWRSRNSAKYAKRWCEVPDGDQEAMRDLVRAREDMKSIELKARQRLGAFLLRHDRI